MRLVSGLPRQVERTRKTVAARGIRRVVNARPSAYPRTPPKAANVLLDCSVPVPGISPAGPGLDVGYDIAQRPPNGSRADPYLLRELSELPEPIDSGTAETGQFFNLRGVGSVDLPLDPPRCEGNCLLTDRHVTTCQTESEIRCVHLLTADHSRSRSPISCAALSFPGPVLPIRAGTMRGRPPVIEIAGDRVQLGSRLSAAPGNTNRPSQGLGTALANHDTVAESGSGHSPPVKSVIGWPSASASA